MADFNTHGGYFAPKDYTRINEGGSHEENPNGGVQLGVDPEGNPNLLEEGEPVYKDYVYSDNIEAEQEFLEQNHLPNKYAGKLYSKIADDLFEEAQERPMDPISRNGLEAMLGRLADAQEGQKQAKEQRELEDELANLSPEELDQLEAMLSQPEAMQGVHPGGDPVGPQGEIGAPEEQMMGPTESMSVEGMPMMSYGGTLLHRFDIGGPIEDELSAAMKERAEARKRKEEYSDAQRDYNSARLKLFAQRFPLRSEHKYNVRELAALKAMQEAYIAGDRLNGGIGEEEALFRQQRRTEKAGERVAKRESRISELEKEKNEAQKRMNAIRFPFAQSFVPVGDDIQSQADEAPAVSVSDTTATQAPVVIPVAQTKRYDLTIDDIDWSAYDESAFYKNGGKINRFAGGGLADFLKLVQSYNVSRGNSPASGRYAIDTNTASNFWGGRDAAAVEAADGYNDFTEYVISNANDPAVQEYLRALDAGINTATGARTLFDARTNQLAKGWEDLYRDRRTDGNLGIYHLTPEDVASIINGSPSAEAPASPSVALPSGVMYDWTRQARSADGSFLPAFDSRYSVIRGSQGAQASAPNLGLPEYKLTNPFELSGSDPKDPMNRAAYRGVTTIGDVAISHPDPFGNSSAGTVQTTPAPESINETADGKVNNDETVPGRSILPTFPRYAGAIGSGLLGLYNAFQSPDRYTAQRLVPFTPEGRIHLQNQVYNPVDQNMIANAQIAQGNATNRALRNSGLGPSSAAAILAADNNTTSNFGTGFLQTWDANNQRRNAVIAANNQAEAQRAQFDYTVDAARKQALNNAQIRNAQNNLMLQRLNYAAEGDKYNAISNQISAGLQALSGIGQENFAMNQVNSNPAFIGYGTNPSGWLTYNPWFQYLESEAKKKVTAEKPAATRTLPTGPLFNIQQSTPLSGYSTDPFMGYNPFVLDDKKKKRGK